MPGNYDPIRNQMPPLASFEVNVPATALIEKWIKDMDRLPAPGCCVGIRTYAVRTLLKSPTIQGHTLTLPMEMPERFDRLQSLADTSQRRSCTNRRSKPRIWQPLGNGPRGCHPAALMRKI